MHKKIALFTAIAVALIHLPQVSSAGETVTVQQSVIDTLTTSPRLEMMKHNRTAINHDMAKARGGYFPQLDVVAGYGFGAHKSLTTRNAAATAPYDDDWMARSDAALILQQLVFDGNEVKSQVDIDRFKIDSINYRVFDNAEALALDAALAALEVYRQQELLKVAEANVAAHEKILESLKVIEQAGAGSSADVIQTRARLSRTMATRITVMSDLETALSNFERLVGYRPDTVQFPENADAVLPASQDEIINMVIASNPKFLAAASDIKVAGAVVNLEKSKYSPKIYLEGVLKYEDGTDGVESWIRDEGVMVRMRWNLFNGMADDAAVKAARARKLQEELNREDIIRTIANDTRATWSRYTAAVQTEKAFAENVSFNEETRTLYSDQFSIGQRSLLDLLDAENEAFQSRGLYTSAKVDRAATAYKLLALPGKLIDTLGIDSAIYKDPKYEKSRKN